MNSQKIRKLVFAATFGALVFAATWISFPSPFGGNVNLGDALLLIGVWMLGGLHGALACAMGAALTDLLGAYAIYAPGTLIIKGCMALTALLLLRLLTKLPTPLRYLLSALGAELVMVAGYYLYEAVFLPYGFIAAAANIPFNLIQAAVAIAVAMLLRVLLHRARLPRELTFR